MPISYPRGSEARLDRRGFVRASVGTEAERRLSAHVAAGLLLAVAVCSVVAIVSIRNTAYFDGLRHGTRIGLFSLLAVLAVTAAGLEWTRSPAADRFAIATGALGTALTLISQINGWWLLSPFIGLATLGVLLTVVHRLMVRDEARHASATHSLFH